VPELVLCERGACIYITAECGEAHVKPCMLRFVVRRPACRSWFFVFCCTHRSLRFVYDCNKIIIINMSEHVVK